jgi:hypothetical protein
MGFIPEVCFLYQIETLERHPMRTRSHRLRDYALYLGISFAVVAAFLLSAYNNLPKATILNWFGYVGFTALVFGFLIENNRSLWKQKRFWQLFGLFLVVHCIVLAAVLLRTGVFGKTWWIDFTAEMVVLNRLSNFLIGRHNQEPKESHTE